MSFGAVRRYTSQIGQSDRSAKEARTMDYTLELVVVPVSDVDRAKDFYINKAGFELLVDTSAGPDFRVVQLVPPGSACAIAIGTGIGSMPPGSLHGLHLCVTDIEAARDELAGRGVELADTFHYGEAGQVPGIDPERRSYATFMPFQDPDGNTWLVQEVKRDWKVQVVKIEDEAAA
jgi:catechol 2,3-dioxygenase-like lactoylglutathione lyase family enzyme